MKKDKKNNKVFTLWSDFKKFIAKGNVVDMAVGVIMGSSFGAIVTALVNIFLALCTWPIPGGISGLITILPPLSASQIPPEGFPVEISVADWPEVTADQLALYTSMYTKHGGSYVYNGVAVLDWGAFINAVVSFLIIALVLFVILKTFNYAKNKAAKLKELELEAYYKKFPDQRPKPAEENAPAPAPVKEEVELLKDIKSLLEKSVETNKTETKE